MVVVIVVIAFRVLCIVIGVGAHARGFIFGFLAEVKRIAAKL